MAVTNSWRVTFRFQNSNDVFYDISIDHDTGVGVARKHGLTVKGSPMHDATETALTVDGASLATWKNYANSQRQHAAVYNTAQALNTILNAAS